MPSVSPKQARLMSAVAHNPAFARKVGIPQKVGEDFNKADEGTGILSAIASGKKPRSRGQLAAIAEKYRAAGR